MAQLKDLLVTGTSRFIGDIYGNLKGTADRAKFSTISNSLYYAECGSESTSDCKVIRIDDFFCQKGTRLIVKFKNENSAVKPPYFKINDIPIDYHIRLDENTDAGIGNRTDGWLAGAIVPFTYDGNGWVRDYWENTITEQKYQIPIITDANAQIKSAECNDFTLPKEGKKDFSIIVAYGNSYKGKLQLNINSTGAKDIYLDGTESSANNYTLLPGLYTAEYDSITGHYNFITDIVSLTKKTIGGPKDPIYLKDGVPTVCTGLNVDLTPYVKRDAKDTPITSHFVFKETSDSYGNTLPNTPSNGQLFFKKGNNNPVLLRKDYLVTESSQSLDIAKVTNSDITTTDNLTIYLNGVLLPEDNYLLKDTTVKFSYQIKSGDILTFIKTTPVNTINLSKFLTTSDSDKYLAKAGDTATGTIYFTKKNTDGTVNTTDPRIIFSNTRSNSENGEIPLIEFLENGLGSFKLMTCLSGQQTPIMKLKQSYNNTTKDFITLSDSNVTVNGAIQGSTVYGAVWNDYAEYRICKDNFIPGMAVCENGDDTLSISKERMQPAAAIVSDTFGFAIGETNDAKCPIAVSGRVLAIPYESREEFKKAIGRPVCAGPNGTVSIMTDEEYHDKGYCAIGTISAVPDYATWGTGNVAVNNRVWIKVG